ncbi:MAG: hypothetical protein ACE5E7_14580 [Anaerolineae bacterium]
MHLDKKREEELAERKGLAVKTIIQTIWLLITTGIAYFIIQLAETQGLLSYPRIRALLTLPPQVENWEIMAALILVFVIIMQFVLFVGFAIASPEGRRRTGTPSLHSRRKAIYDEEHYR